MDIREIRSRIDEINGEMLELFIKRMELSEEVAKYKNEHSLPILNRAREREVLADVMAKAGDKDTYAYQLFQTLFELSKARQSELYSAPTPVREKVEKAIAAAE